MHFQTSSYIAIMLIANAAAQVLPRIFPFPKQSGQIVGDGLIRPDYRECDTLSEQFQGTSKAGPGINEGTTVTGLNCTLRVAKCGTNTAGEFDIPGASNMYEIIKRECGNFTDPSGVIAGCVYRAGDACFVVEHPSRPFIPTSTSSKRAPASQPSAEAGLRVDHDPVSPRSLSSSSGLNQKQHRRSLVAEAMALKPRECNPPPGPCYTYTEGVFLTNIRGFPQRVCDSVLPNGARCDNSRAVTTSRTISVGASIGVTVESIITATGSFSTDVSNSTTETLTTSITVSCPKSGYVVWTPFMEVSRGICAQGPKQNCNGGCFTDTMDKCSLAQPVKAGGESLSGEYSVECV